MLIAFEGIDGSGKTTISTRINEELERRGIRSHWTTEPTDGPIGRIIREVLEGRMEVDHRTLALLFAADRMQHVIQLEDLLEEGYTVISDRYLLSSLAYQGCDLPMEWVKEINKWALLPDLVIYLDLDPALALERVKEKQLFHTLRKLRSIRANYLSLIREEEWSSRTVVVDASREEEEVFQTVLNIILKKLRVV